MGRKDIKEIIRQNNDKKSLNPIILLLAFMIGAVTTVAVFWRMLTSKGKKGTAVSDDAIDRDYEAADREMKHLLGVLRRESERRMWGDPEIRISGDYGVSGVTPANVKTQKVKPYRPRKRVSAKKIFVRATAVAAAAALVVTGLTLAPSDRMPVSTVLAKESFGGIRQVVEEHDEDNPFVILDIVPGKASAVINGKTYDFSLGTIGYLAPGQSPIQQDLFRIFTGDDSTAFYKYEDRKKLTDSVIANGYSSVSYQEAYGGTGEDLKASVWTKIFDRADVDHDATGKLTGTVPYPTGRLYATVEQGTGKGFDYKLTEGSISFGASAMNTMSVDGIYTYAEGGTGDYQVIFEGPEMAVSGYRAEVIKSGSYDEVVLGGSYSDATGVYIVQNGEYRYACTIGEFKGIPRPEPDPEDQDKTPKPNPGDGDDDQDQGDQDDDQGDQDDDQDDQDDDQDDQGDQGDQGDEGDNGQNQGGDDQDNDDQNQGGEEHSGESQPASEQAAAFQTKSALEMMAGTGGRWYLCVGTEPTEESAVDESERTEETDESEQTGETDESDRTEESGDDESEQPDRPEESEVTSTPGVEDGTYCILKFSYVETEDEEQLYQVKEVIPISTGEGNPRPYDSYVLENSLLLSGLNAEDEAETLADEPSVEGKFEYVGDGAGDYRLTRVRSMENVVAVTDAVSPDAEVQDADTQSSSLKAVEIGLPHYIEVQNAPVYIRCAGGNDWLRRYVFNSLKSQDNASDDFAIRVDTVLAGDVTYEMVQEADLVYLEDGAGLYLDPDAKKSYIYTGAEESDEVGLADISDTVITRLLYEVVVELKPIIVDYGVITNQDNYAGTKYQKLAKAFLKKDLTAFYNEMAKSDDLAASILMNVDKDSKEFPNKTDNDYHYVNRNVYLVNGTSLVEEDFPEEMDKDKAKSGFSEVLAAIRAENVMLSEDEKISEKVSKAMAVQYIINYSLGLVGEYKDLSILELQPTANMTSDLYRDVNNDKGSVVLYWQRSDQDGGGQQILRSSKMIETNVTLRSVAAFNTSYQDINEDYNMIFIGLDGQRLYRERNQEGNWSAVYNDSDLNGKVYHTGDRVAGSDTRYDANDITEQKKEALLDYLRAGYPIVVENECFKGKSARNAKERDINTKYIASDTQMYSFLKEAISMDESDGDDENGIGIYTIEDVHSSAMFAMQLNAQRPKIELWYEGQSGEDDSEEIASDMIMTESVPEKPGVLRGTIEYRITSDRAGEDKTYMGSLERHLYLDLNYDGVYAPEEEIYEYLYEETAGGGKVSVDFNEISFGIVPWKLEVTDAANSYRRAATQGCFTISNDDEAKVWVLQVLDDVSNNYANIQEQYEKIDESMLAHYLRGAEASLNMNWKIETVTPSVLADRLSKNANYLSMWDVVVLGFGDSGNPGDVVTTAVNDYITAGGSILVSSAGASTDKGRLGIAAAVLGQSEEQTYGRLGLNSSSKFRYEGIEAGMFNKTEGLLVDRINDGTVSRWPYQIGETASLEGTEVSMPDYLLDIGTAKDTGQAYATAWFTLIDGNYDGGYSVSPRDGRNNYYVYSMGNVVYVGQSEYPYTYNRQTGETPDGAGMDECRIFVNALMAAYNAGVHRAQVSIVAGFNGVTKVESVTVPYDVAFKESGDGTRGGILGETVDVYFRFTDNNIARDKTTELSLYYKNPGAGEETSLLQADGTVNTADYTAFTSLVWAVENNRLVEVSEGLVPGKVYRIKAPLAALQNGEDETSEICVVLTNRYTRAGQNVEALSMDSVSLNRAQMFLLE